jgi:hypothetical protein
MHFIGFISGSSLEKVQKILRCLEQRGFRKFGLYKLIIIHANRSCTLTEVASDDYVGLMEILEIMLESSRLEVVN